MDLSNLNEILSVILNDGESFTYLNELVSQLNTLENQANIWNGKRIHIFTAYQILIF